MPAAKATRTTITSGARHCAPKNQCTAISCWLFSANANSVKKMNARISQVRMRIARAFYGARRNGWHRAASGIGLRGVAGHHGQLVIDGFPQRLARLEVRHQLLGDGHLLAAARIATHTRRAAIDREAAEAADLDAMA